MNYKKIKFAIGMVFLGIILVYSFWGSPLILSILLIVIAFLKHRIYPIKSELLMFVVGGVIATLAESITMKAGAWSYSTQHLLNFPIWLPFLWGLASINGITLYQGLTSSK